MNRYAWMSLLFAASLSGCMPTSFVAPEAKNVGTRSAEPPQSTALPPVTAAQINSDNAQEKAQALRAELNRDWEQAIESNEAKPDKK